MATFSQVIRQRRDAVKLLKRLLRAVDSSLEVIERKQNSMVARTNKVPEAYELAELAKLGRDLYQKYGVWAGQLEASTRFFGQ
jgi:hypothetical protein